MSQLKDDKIRIEGEFSHGEVFVLLHADELHGVLRRLILKIAKDPGNTTLELNEMIWLDRFSHLLGNKLGDEGDD